MTTALQLAGVCKRYQGHEVLRGIDLSVKQAEFVGLIGVNGAGKTTLIKCLLDFTLPDSGSINIFDIPHRHANARSRLVYLPEKFVPPYYLTGRDFLNYMASLHRVEINETELGNLLRVLDLEASALKKPVRQYSKGMAQKLGLATCFLSGKELLVLDEPMSGLDPRARAWLKQYLLELKQSGHSLFFSTHLLADVEVLSDQIAILHNGQVQFSGTIEQCYEKYECDDIEQAYLNCIQSDVSH